MGTVLTVVVVVAGIALLTLFAGGPARERGLRRPLGVLFDTSIPPEHETRGIPASSTPAPLGRVTVAAQALTGFAYVTLALVLWIGVHVVVAAIIVGLIGVLAFVLAWDSLRRRRRIAGSAPRP